LTICCQSIISEIEKATLITGIPPEKQAPIVALVERILAAKKADKTSDIAALEAKSTASSTTYYKIGGPLNYFIW
jgi:hypothetical protein